MRSIIVALLLVILAGAGALRAQSLESVEPFKVGTFEVDGVATVALVPRDSLIVDIAAANAALELDPTYPHVAMPADMLELNGARHPPSCTSRSTGPACRFRSPPRPSKPVQSYRGVRLPPACVG